MSDNAQQWLNTRFPKCKKVDVDWTFERCNFPQFVRSYIVEHWDKVSDDNGGVFSKPVNVQQNNEEKVNIEQNTQCEETKDTKESISIDNEKKFANNIKNSGIYTNMDSENQKAIDIASEEGMNKAIDFMFTDQETGRRRTYAEMRMMYG